jgi:predicted ABC-type ATPase
VNREANLGSLSRLLAADNPVLLVLAGSNGAGKSTFFDLYLSRLGLPFVNAHRIAQTLSPHDPLAVAYQAAQVAELMRRDLLSAQQSFCMKAVFSDPEGQKVRFLRDAQSFGYAVVFVNFRLSDLALCTARITQRVARGGHHVPDGKLQMRFERTLRNASTALGFVELGFVVDNSSARKPDRLVEC